MATPEIISIPIPQPPPRTTTVIHRVSPSTDVTLVTRFIIAVRSFFTFLPRLGAFFVARVKPVELFVFLTLTTSTLVSFFRLEFNDKSATDYNNRTTIVIALSNVLILIFIIERVMDWKYNPKPWWNIFIENFVRLILILGTCAIAAASYLSYTYGYRKTGVDYISIGTLGLTWLYGFFTNFLKDKHSNLVQHGTTDSFRLKKCKQIPEDPRNRYYQFYKDNLVVTEAERLSRLDQLEDEVAFWKTKYDEVQDENAKLKYLITKFEEDSKSLKSSSLFGETLRVMPRSSLKVSKSRNSALVTKREIGDSLEEFLSKATEDKGLIRLMMCMGEAIRTIAFKVRTASCGGTACVNSFGDEQLAVDMLADKLLFEALTYSHSCKYACSEEVPELQDMGGPVEGGFSVAFDPLDGSSIVDTNFTVGTIFGVWPGDKLTGVTGRDQVAAAMGIYGPRTTYVIALKDCPGTHEFLLLDEGKWQHVKDTTEISEGKMFSPGNLRATFDNPDYKNLIDYYVKEKYTLRYSGGMVPDVNQIIVKEKGVFTNVLSPTTKAKLRLLFEVAPLGLLIEQAGGYSSDGKQSVLDKVIVNLDDRTQVAYGSKNEIIRFEETLYGSSRLKTSVPVGASA